jgi:DNA-binding response OmpR family regulator
MVAGGRRILVIEDDVLGAEALTALLELRGHTVSLAHTGRLGLEAAIVERPDIIVLDLGLPDLHGCEVIRRIRAGDHGAEPIIIAYSGWHLLEGPADDAGCDAFVLKPGVDELEALIQKDGHIRERRGPGSVYTSRRRADAR